VSAPETLKAAIAKGNEALASRLVERRSRLTSRVAGAVQMLYEAVMKLDTEHPPRKIVTEFEELNERIGKLLRRLEG
jgi:phage shock protein A